jgi:glycosyltransferase involved in cell wall biosynthesis
MKILHLSTSDSGGAGIAAIRLHIALLSFGVDSSIFFLERTKNTVPHSYYFSDFNRQNGNYILRLAGRIIKKLLFKFSNRYRNYKKLINKPEGFEIFSFNPTDIDVSKLKIIQEADIIHLHWVAGFFDFKEIKNINKPFLWTLHDMNPFTGGCHYSYGCEKFKSECVECPQLKGTIDQNNSFEDQKYKIKYLRLDKLIITAPSEWLVKCSTESKLFRLYQHYNIFNSLDLTIFRPQNKEFCRNVFNLDKNKITILFVSDDVVNHRKGFSILLKAMDSVDHDKVQLCAIGYRNESINTSFNVRFLGHLSDERLLSIAYSAADLLILPSLEDNLPNVMIESLACGTPVMSFNTGGMSQIINDGFNGILAKEKSADGLGSSLNRFLRIHNTFDKTKISNDAAMKFSQVLQAQKYIQIYKSIYTK